MNLSCIICSDLFSSVDDAYVTNCGHIFHYKCIIQWLERSRTCPQCRSKTNEKSIHRVYFNIINNDTTLDSGALQCQVDDLNLKIKVKDSANKAAEDENLKLQEENKKNKRSIQLLHDKVKKYEFLSSTYADQIKSLKFECSHLEDLKKEINHLKGKIELMHTIEFVVTATMQEVEELLTRDSNPKTLAVLVASLKRELRSSEARRNDLRVVLKNTQQDFRKEQETRRKLEEVISEIESENYKLVEEKKNLEKGSLKLNSDENISLNISKDLKRKYASTSNTQSPSLSEKVKIIQNSDSPYLKIKSSSIGLAPLLKLGPQNAEHSNVTERLSIFKKPRILENLGVKAESNYAFNGLGISQKKENFKSFGETKSTAARIKSGRIKKIDI